LLDPPNQAAGDGIWFHDPDGVVVNVRIAESAPHGTDPEWIVNMFGNYRRVNQRVRTTWKQTLLRVSFA
jgi:hypothetical protein